MTAKSGGMWLSGSDTGAQSKRLPAAARPFVVLGNPDCRRVERFQEALARLDLPEANVIAWTDFLAGRVALPDVVPPNAIFRIEAPGTAFETERALLARGAELPDEEAEYARMPRNDALTMDFDKGRIVCPRQWYLGFQNALQEVAAQQAACPVHTVLNSPADIAAMFDKPRCQERLRAAGLPTPRPLGLIASFDDMTARMRQTNCKRVFVKLAHGSSASGVIAYRTNGAQHQATTTVEMETADGRLTLYNTRRIQVYRDVKTIAALIDALCRHRVYAEEWIPKAGMDGHAFDLRVVVIGGRACHALARLSHKPMTNLHLRNPRRDWAFVQNHIGNEATANVLHTSEQAARCFPDNLYAGADVLLTPGFGHCALLEMNAFGDLLPGTLYEGHDTYTTEILRALNGAPSELPPADGQASRPC